MLSISITKTLYWNMAWEAIFATVSLVPSSIDNFCKNAFSTISPENLESSEWVFSDSDEDESLEELECLAIKDRCGELWEEIYDEDNVHIRRKKGDGRKKNKSSAKPLKRKTCKINLNKTFASVSKWREFFGIAKVLKTWLK